MIAGMLIPLLPLMIGAGLLYTWVDDRSASYLITGVIIVAVSVAVGVAILGYNAGFGLAIVPAMVPYLLAPLSAVAFSWLKAPTRKGRATMDKIEGFKQYLSVAEEDRLEYLNPPKKTPELFEKFLPYAIALDVQNAWARRFAGVLAAAGVAAAGYGWYQSDGSTSSDPVSFADRIGDSLSKTISSASTPPGSSGSSSDSGGSSGGGNSGGGGGGGGSGW
jgi:uncharacterized membrane protein